MKKILFYHWICSLTFYTLVYIIKTFIIWEFTNPFQWIIDLPKYDAEQRGFGLLMIAFWQLFQLFIVWSVLKPETKTT